MHEFSKVDGFAEMNESLAEMMIKYIQQHSEDLDMIL